MLADLAVQQHQNLIGGLYQAVAVGKRCGDSTCCERITDHERTGDSVKRTNRACLIPNEANPGGRDLSRAKAHKNQSRPESHCGFPMVITGTPMDGGVDTGAVGAAAVELPPFLDIPTASPAPAAPPASTVHRRIFRADIPEPEPPGDFFIGASVTY